MKTAAGKIAKDAVEALENRAVSAERQVVNLEQQIGSLVRQLEETERRMYGSTARAITDFMQVSNTYDFGFDMEIIRLEPKSVQIGITRRELFDAKHSMAVIDHHIERVLEMHTDDLRKQLRAAVWPRR